MEIKSDFKIIGIDIFLFLVIVLYRLHIKLMVEKSKYEKLDTSVVVNKEIFIHFYFLFYCRNLIAGNKI